MKRTLRQTITSIILSNAIALCVFYFLYKYGISKNIPMVEQYFIIPLSILSGYLIHDDYKQIKSCII